MPARLWKRISLFLLPYYAWIALGAVGWHVHHGRRPSGSPSCSDDTTGERSAVCCDLPEHRRGPDGADRPVGWQHACGAAQMDSGGTCPICCFLATKSTPPRRGPVTAQPVPRCRVAPVRSVSQAIRPSRRPVCRAPPPVV